MTRIANFCPICGTALKLNSAGRPTCQQCGHIVYFDPKVAVVVWVQEGPQLLLVQRAYDPQKGKWALPAGFVDYDEAPETAAIREVREETGLHVVITGLLDVFPKRDDGLADIIIAYRARQTGGELLAADDAADVRWFTQHNLPQLAFYPSQTLVSRWLRGEL